MAGKSSKKKSKETLENNSIETLENNSIETLENNSIETLETTNNGSLYVFDTYLNCLSMTLDGTYKLYPSKYIALSGGSYEDVVKYFNEYLKTFDKTDERYYETLRVLPFCLDNSGEPILNDDNNPEAQISDPNVQENTYTPQVINKDDTSLGTIICGGDINFLNHTVDANETILYVSQSDMQDPCCITMFNTENLDISETIFVRPTSATNPNYPDNITFNAIFVFFNVYRKVGESIDELDDCWLRDMPGFIYMFDDVDLSSGSQKEWCTRIFSSFVNDSFENTSTISTTDLKQINEDIVGFNATTAELEELLKEEYTDLKEVKEYYTEFKNNRHVNVPYIQGNWWYVNGKKAGKAFVDISGKEFLSGVSITVDEPLDFSALLSDDGTINISGSIDLKNYLTKDDVSSAYQPILTAGNYISLSSNIVTCTLSAGDNISISSSGKISAILSGYATDSDLSDYLTKDDAASTYQPILTAGDYITLSSGTYGPNSRISCTLSAGDNISISSSGKISADLSEYVKTDDLENQMSSILDNYQLHITSISNPSGWPALTLTDNTTDASLSFTGGHYHQTYVSDGAHYDYDADNPYLDGNTYMQQSYGITPYTSEPLINTSTNAQTYNMITAQVIQENTNSGFSTYDSDSSYVKNTAYYKKPFAYTRIMTRDNSFKDFIPRAYMQVTPDIIEFLIDTHTEATSNRNYNPTWSSVMGSQEKPSYSTHVWIDNAGFHIGEVKLSVSGGKLYVNDVEVELKS